MIRHARALFVLTTLVAAFAIPAAAGAAVDPCPNAAVRAQQNAQHLPDCRAWELVSQANKNNTQAFIVSPLSPDGTRVLYDTIGGFDGTVSGAHPQLIATRASSGWTSKDILPPPAQWPGQNYLVGAVDSNITAAAMSSFDGLGQTTNSPDVSILRLPFDNTQTLLHTFPTYFGASGVELVASDDLTHVFANVPEQIDPSHQMDTHNVYDFGSGMPQLVSRMPTTGLAPTCGVPAGSNPLGFATPSTSNTQHWISTDGSKVFFQTRGDDVDAPACDDPLHLYVRDLDAGTTTRISDPVVVGDTDLGVVRFHQATPDGSLVTYRTATSLDAADDIDGNATDQDIYQWTDDGGNVCLTCVVENAAVSANGRVAVSQDGAYVYFASARQLADAPAAATNGAPNLYVWHDDAIEWITRGNSSSISDRPIDNGDLTPDGKVLIFTSNRPELDAVSGSTNNGLLQVYRYDDTDESVTCLSCPAAGGAAPEVESSVLAASRQVVQADVRSVSDDGSMVFFLTSEVLVPEDVNMRPDIYEWHDGDVGLITSGVVNYPMFLGPEIVSASADGSDILFKDLARLTHDAQDSSFKLYTARVNGGFPAPPTSPASCAGEGCQSPPSPQPGPLGAGSDTFAVGGNVNARARVRKCGPSKRKVRRGGRTRCVKRKRANHNRRAGR